MSARYSIFNFLPLKDMGYASNGNNESRIDNSDVHQQRHISNLKKLINFKSLIIFSKRIISNLP
jgi:hypothetical protein